MYLHTHAFSVSLSSLYVIGLGFLSVWQHQGSKTSYIASGFLRVSISKDPGGSYKVLEIVSEYTQA